MYGSSGGGRNVRVGRGSGSEGKVEMNYIELPQSSFRLRRKKFMLGTLPVSVSNSAPSALLSAARTPHNKLSALPDLDSELFGPCHPFLSRTQPLFSFFSFPDAPARPISPPDPAVPPIDLDQGGALLLAHRSPFVIQHSSHSPNGPLFLSLTQFVFFSKGVIRRHSYVVS